MACRLRRAAARLTGNGWLDRPGIVDQPPGGSVGEQRPQQLVVHGMAGGPPDEAPAQRRTGKIQVAQAVEHLVPDELVRKAQSLVVENAITADHDGVLQRAAPSEPMRPQFLHPLGEAEGAGAGDRSS